MIKESYEHIRTWKAGDFRLEMYDTHSPLGGRAYLAYQLYFIGELIFEGNNFGCSPLHAIDSDAIVASLLNFLSLKPGDTDAEYFDKYTPRQLEWCREFADGLSIHAQELEWEHRRAKR